jgi:hypothetical protein
MSHRRSLSWRNVRSCLISLFSATTLSLSLVGCVGVPTASQEPPHQSVLPACAAALRMARVDDTYGYGLTTILGLSGGYKFTLPPQEVRVCDHSRIKVAIQVAGRRSIVLGPLSGSALQRATLWLEVLSPVSNGATSPLFSSGATYSLGGNPRLCNGFISPLTIKLSASTEGHSFVYRNERTRPICQAFDMTVRFTVQ